MDADPNTVDTQVHVEKALSSKGNEYTITRPAGGPPGGHPNAPHSMAPASSGEKEDFGISVYWVPEDHLNAHRAPPVVEETASITYWTLVKRGPDSNGNYTCTLHFTNTKTYGYHFYDQTGDRYWVSTWTNGDHTVGYTSKKPIILFITGD